MPSTLNPPLASGATRSSNILKVWLPLAAFAVLWADLIRQLSYEWRTNEQYGYGWFVPFFALALFWKRWLIRPAARPQASPLWLVALVVVAALVLLPVRVVHEINQDWPLFSWPLTLGVVGISLYAIFLLGGWAWVRHFAFPVCFILVAVQWPYRIEHGLTQGLMRVVAGLTVELLGWFNIPAFQHGNLIEVSTGVVGIDEACSGIRSLQSTIMAALFLGELYRLRWRMRLRLLALGIALAFCFNVVRTLILTWRASSAGIAALEKWHDPAGLTIMVACFFALWGVTVWLRPRPGHGSRTTEQSSSSPVVPLSGNPVVPVPSPADPPPSPSEKPNSPGSLGSLPRWFTLALVGWVGILLIGNEVWYRSHELKPVESVHWWVNYPTNLLSFREVPISQSVRKILKYDVGTSATWEDPDGGQWDADCFRWRAGSPTARMSALAHRPEYCLTGSGNQMNAELGTRYFPANGLKLPFRIYIFNAPERPLYVFFCLWADGTEKQTGFGKTKYHDRLRSVLAGRRGLGQQTLELILTGYLSLETAEQAVRERLPGLIKTENHTADPAATSDR